MAEMMTVRERALRDGLAGDERGLLNAQMCLMEAVTFASGSHLTSLSVEQRIPQHIHSVLEWVARVEFRRAELSAFLSGKA